MSEGTALSAFASLLGLAPHHAEDALHSERVARAVLTRRSLLAAGGALASGAVFSFAGPAEIEIAQPDPDTEALRDALRRLEAEDRQLAAIQESVKRIAAIERELLTQIMGAGLAILLTQPIPLLGTI